LELWIGDAAEIRTKRVRKRKTDRLISTIARLCKSYTRYRQCDDAAIAEGSSESVGRILVDHWNTQPRLAYLARRNRDFRCFVLGHIDETLNLEDVNKIRANAESRCPTGLRDLCRDIRE